MPARTKNLSGLRNVADYWAAAMRLGLVVSSDKMVFAHRPAVVAGRLPGRAAKTEHER
jgi:hypothetical protein